MASVTIAHQMNSRGLVYIWSEEKMFASGLILVFMEHLRIVNNAGFISRKGSLMTCQTA